jgi:hypothetical protein
MLTEAPDADDFEWPKPKDADEWEDPLFDSTRDYVEQVGRFKKHRGKSISFKEPTFKSYTCVACGIIMQRVRPTQWCSQPCRDKRRDKAAV